MSECLEVARNGRLCAGAEDLYKQITGKDRRIKELETQLDAVRGLPDEWRGCRDMGEVYAEELQAALNGEDDG